MDLIVSIVVLLVIVTLFIVLYILNEKRISDLEKKYMSKLEDVSKQVNIANHLDYERNNAQSWNIDQLKYIDVTQEWVNDKSTPKWDNIVGKPNNFATTNAVLNRNVNSWQTSTDGVNRVRFASHDKTSFGSKNGYDFYNASDGKVLSSIDDKGTISTKGNVVFDGVNGWIVNKDDTKRTLSIAPRVNNQWNFNAQTRFEQDGKVYINELCIGNTCLSARDVHFLKNMMGTSTLIRSISGLVGFYTGDSWYSAANMWVDLSGNNNHALEIRQSPNNTISVANFGNGKKFIQGNVNTGLRFPGSILPSQYTLFYIAKYNGASRQRIFNGVNQNWLSGFWNGRSGVAHHNAWLTNPPNDLHQSTWVLGTDQNNLYRSNKVQRSTRPPGAISNDRLSINFGSSIQEYSDWAVGCVVVYNRWLTQAEIIQIENELSQAYQLGF
jgi:hypothetical protein